MAALNKLALPLSVTDLKADQTTVHVIKEPKCGQLDIATSLVAEAKILMGAKVGTCPSDGFTVDNGPK